MGRSALDAVELMNVGVNFLREHVVQDARMHYAITDAGDFRRANASTDVGDVSWICPTAQAHTATFVGGTPGHSWQATTVGKTTAAHKMMLYAAKSMAALAVELIRDEALLARAKAEHKKRVGPNGYRCPIPAGVKPRAMNGFSKKE